MKPTAEATRDGVGTPSDSSPTFESQELFRQEAVQHHARRSRNGAPLRISPRWAGSAYWILFGAFVTGIAFLFFARQREYASGPAVVRLTGHYELTAPAPGIVGSVDVRQGESVHAQEVLVRFQSKPEEDVLERTQGEFDIQLARWLREPNPSVHASLVTLKSDLKLARARLEQRIVRAPHDGVVSDVRIRAGQPLQSGEPVIVLVGPDAKRELVAFVSAEYRPRLMTGQPLRLRIRGYSRTSILLEVTSISDEAVGPSEARRFLGFELGDAIQVTGSVIVVRAGLKEPTFLDDGESHAYYSGMLGSVEIAVHDERLIMRLVPGLKAVGS